MGKSKGNRPRPITVEEAERQLERARRREAGPSRIPAVDLANLDTPGVTHAEQYAEFLNRPGDFYVARIEIPLDDDPLGEKLGATATLKADSRQLPYLVEVLRQVRGALGERTRIELVRAEVADAAPAAEPPVAERGIGARHAAARDAVMARQREAQRAIVESERRLDEARRLAARRSPAEEMQPDPDLGEAIAAEGIRVWCCGTSITGPHVAGCMFEPRPDNPIDYGGPAVIADPTNGYSANGHGRYTPADGPPMQYGRDWVAEGQEFDDEPPTSAWQEEHARLAEAAGRDLTPEEIAAMLPGQTRAETAAELGKRPEDLGGSIPPGSGLDDAEAEQIARDLGVPVSALRKIEARGGNGYAWVVIPSTEMIEQGRHARPEPEHPDEQWRDARGPQ